MSASGDGVEITEAEEDWYLTGTAVGSYTITVTYQDTEQCYSSKTTTFQMNVVDSIYSLELTSDSEKEMICSGETQTISAVARKEDTTGTAQIEDYTIQWNVTAKEDVVTYTSDGKSITLCGVSAGKVISPATVFKEEQREYSCDCGYQTVVSGFQISGLAKGDFIKSIRLDNKTYAKLSKVDLKKGTFTIKALKKKGKANLYITLASPGKEIKVPVKIQTGKVKTSKVSLAEKVLTLKKGTSTVMTPTKKPFTSTEKITYKTSNKKVVKVTSQSGGRKVKLTAVAPGTAKITVKAGKKKAECTVTVPGIGNIKSSVTLKRKKSTTLKPKRYGIKGNVTYTSSNPAVAVVNAKGKVTGVKKGTATITIKAGGYTATCKVKVK